MKTKWHVLIALFGMFYMMCGLFTPREITTVPAVSEAGDPFFLSDLLEGTGETFPRFTWQEFFNENCLYDNVTLSSTTYSRDGLVNHLLQQHELYPDVKIDWTRTEKVDRESDKISLNNVTYKITDPHFADSVLFSGSSDFVLVRDSSSVFKIVQWRDYADVPFFTPEM